ncbi:helix-turn-helix domain-containing protein [uncultured Methylobacterium sp.]|jgi:transcriptional regulator with XRE-family HTH domain|uniref:helix-turn-helix domain-containing protein n=1 Tax=uncultured Methylobacterium sp. TaxID=157278 RepID=UPI0026201702|nr:helix-turn-helix domain-containing protein [uncultured Methylobacterium sp.]
MSNSAARRSLGEGIKHRRQRLGITQTELARAVGYSTPSPISKFERGYDVPHDVLPRIARALKVDTNALLDGAAVEPSPEEREILRAFRAMPDEGRAYVFGLMVDIAAGRVAR